MRLTQIIKGLIKVIEENDLSISDEVLFEQASSFLRGELAGKSYKESREFNQIKKEIESDKPSQKQIDFLNKNKIKMNPNLTRQEASIMINNFIKLSNNSKREGRVQ